VRPRLGAPVDLVIFDLDGTLVDSFEDIRAGLKEACAAIGLAAEAPMLALASRGAPLEEFYRLASGADPHAEGERARFQQFREAYRHHYLPSCTLTTVPFPGVVAVLEALRARRPRPRLAVATTKRTETAERVLAGTGLRALFDAVAGSDDLPHKPDPAVLRRAAALAGADLDAGAAVMVGDTDRDVGAAHAAGIRSIAVTWGGFSEAELRMLGPSAIASTPEELLALLP